MSEKKIGFTAPLEFIRSVKVELRSVKWPTRQETIRLTLLVIFVSLFVAVYIGSLDLAFTALVSRIINR
jgi:preprotein translocase subunit SecE